MPVNNELTSDTPSAEAILYGRTRSRGIPEQVTAPISISAVSSALAAGTYWVNGKGEVVPIKEIDIIYAFNIRSMIRRRLDPEEYLNTPLWTALGKIRRRRPDQLQ